MFDINLFMKSNKSTVKDTIVSILSNEWPLSAQKIFNGINKRYNMNVSYQAVHKALKELTNSKIIMKEKRNYMLNINWLEQYCEFLERAKSNYFLNKPMFLPGLKEFKQDGTTQTFVFDTLSDAERYRKHLQFDYISKRGTKQPYCGSSRHLKSPIVFSEKSINILNVIRKTKTNCYIIVSGGTKIDEWCADYYRNEFVKVKTGIKFSMENDIMVIGDIITQLFIPKNIQKELDKIYTTAKNIQKISVPDFYKNVYTKKSDIKFVVFKNKEIAEQLRQQIMSHFDKKDGVAIFDVDGTLVNGFLIVQFSKFLTDSGCFNKKIFDKIMVATNEYDSGQRDYISVANKIVEAYAEGMKGQKISTIKRHAKKFIENERIPLFKFSKDLFNYVNSKMFTVALTGSPKEILDEMNHIFQFDFRIATELEIKDGIYTGEILKNMALPETKTTELRKLVEANGMSFDRSVGFGDTQSDLPFLNMVKMPIVINPNKELRKFANKKNWAIFHKGNRDVVNYVKRLTAEIL